MEQAFVLPGGCDFSTSAAISLEGAVDLLVERRGEPVQTLHLEGEAMAELCEAWLMQFVCDPDTRVRLVDGQI